MTNFGRLKKVDLYEIWKHEAKNFTPWLAKNIKSLGEILGMDLELQQQEAKVGKFSLDLLAKDLGSNRLVVIENQLTQTDHNHLGKLLTYAGGFDANVIVWIAEKIRDEHRQALEWLNQNTGADIFFFGVVIEVLQIDQSKPAFNFKPVVYPNEWNKDQWSPGDIQLTPKAKAYKVFFQKLIDELREKHNFTNARKGQPQSWYSFSSGITGLYYSVSFGGRDKFRVELYIDTGKRDQNKEIFDWLLETKDEIELEIGSILEWERLDDKQSSRIFVAKNGAILDKEKVLEELESWAIEKLLCFKEVFSKRLKAFKSRR